MENLMRYEWPGNVRELRNIVERAVLMSEDGIIEPADIVNMDMLVKDHHGDKSREPELLHEAGEGSVDNKLKKLEKKLIVAALVETGGVQARAAELLGIKERSLWHRIKKHDIDPASFK